MTDSCQTAGRQQDFCRTPVVSSRSRGSVRGGKPRPIRVAFPLTPSQTVWFDTTMSTPTPPPGWHADPADPNRVRYWDGVKWTDKTDQRPVSVAKKPLSPKRALAILGALIVALGVYGGYHAITGPSADEEAAAELAESKAQESEDFARDSAARAAQAVANAEVQCQQLVTDRLIAPATADFVDVKTKAGSSPGELVTAGSVDSENAFGANLRSTFTCVTSFGGTTVKTFN